MNDFVSRIRAQRLRSRERAERRSSAPPFSLQESRALALAMAIALLALATLLLGSPNLLSARVAMFDRLPFFGESLLLLLSLLACLPLLSILRPELVRRNSSLLLLATIAATSFAFTWAIGRVAAATPWVPHEALDFLIPLAMPSLLATLLLNPAAGAVVGLWCSAAYAGFAQHPFPILIAGLAATAVSISGGSRVRTRGQALRLGLLAGLSQISVVFAVTAMNAEAATLGGVIAKASACLAGGFAASILVLMILPAFETLFGVVTGIRLLELSDPGHPLLQRLALEAPGTYHHSLVVANLAQEAAARIGANSLLARVCACFHDVGKLTKPEFFMENLAADANPHDRLAPSMSKLIITSHVKEGAGLAVHYRLPKQVIQVILEHHGTSLVKYFHQKARHQLEFDIARQAEAGSRESGSVHEEHYRYDGPTPTSRESAIVSLADAVEAASRSLEKVTASNLDDLVTDIVNLRFDDGQLENCQLTLAELHLVKRSFVFTLSNMLHRRLAYPKDERDRG